MRILLVSDYATPTGGAEMIVLGLRDALRSRNHDARLFASSARPLGKASLADYHCFGVSSCVRGLTQIWNPSAFFNLRAVLRDFNPDVVHVRLFLSQLSPAILSLLGNTPTLFHVAWYRTICPLGTKMLPNGRDCQTPAGMACVNNRCIPAYALPSVILQRWFLKRGFSSFNAIIANSRTTSAQLRAENLPVDGIVWNGVHVGPVRTHLAPTPTVAFAGRLVWEKGADILVDAFHRVRARVPNARLLIAGEGPERARLQAQVDALGLSSSVVFLGHLTGVELTEHFLDAWVQVVPSRWLEPFGLVAGESFMRGTPVIASNEGGLAEFIQHGQTGLLCERGRVEPLAEALQYLLTSPDLALEMGHRARQFAMENLDFEVFTDRILSIYRSVIDGRAIGPASGLTQIAIPRSPGGSVP